MAEDQIMEYAPGDRLFEQGDESGDLYFIEDGTIEILTHKDHQEIILAEMGKGEIIGVMTLLTSDTRMAAARAKTAAVCKKIPASSVKKTLTKLPNWLNIVLKEFTHRLSSMNQSYSESVLQNKALEDNQRSAVYLSGQIAGAIATISPFMGKKSERGEFVIVEELVEKVEAIVNVDRKYMEAVFKTMVESGLLKLEIEPDKKRTVVLVEQAIKLIHYAKFVKESKRGKARKMIREGFSNKESRVMAGLVKLAKKFDMDLNKRCRLVESEVFQSMEKTTGISYDRSALEKGIRLGLLEFEKDDSGQMIVFVPAEVGRSVASVEAIRRLDNLDEKFNAPLNQVA